MGLLGSNLVLSLLRNFKANCRGATTMEYGLYAMAISLAIVPAVQSLGTKSGNVYSTIGTALTVPEPSVATATVTGTSGNDVLYAVPGANTTFIGGEGSDAMHGNVGSYDTASYSTSTGGIFVSIPYGIATGDAYGDTYDSIEEIAGSAHDDTMDAGTSGMALSGGGGNDVLTGRDLNGGIGNDQLFGLAGGTNIYRFKVGDGSDIINAGNNSADKIIFGAGVTSANITFNLQATKLDISYGSGDAIRIQNINNAIYRVETIEFADGSSCTISYTAPGGCS